MKNKSKILAYLLAPLLGVLAVTTPSVKTINAMSTIDEVQEPLIKYDFTYMDEQKEMPILGYMGVPGDAINGSVAPSFLTRANIQAYMDAGFNILSGLYEKVPLHNAEVMKALEICEELGLTYFVCDNAYRSSFDSPQQNVPTKEDFVESMSKDFYFESPAFGGIAVRDEPNIFCFDQMSSVNAAVSEITENKKIMYTNLFPKGANQQQLGFSSSPTSSTWEQYEQYVSDYLAKVQPAILAYDCYTLTAPNCKVSDVNAGKGVVGNYIKSLSMFREYANKYNIPFWVTVAAHDHIRSGQSIPLKQTRWTVNTSLAFGAKGIQYYTYWNDGAGTEDKSNWANQNSRSEGLVSYNGALSDNYYRIQSINNQIKLVDHILMLAEHKGVMQFGTQHVELIAKDVLYNYGELRNISGDAFVGCFEYNGNDVYYVVNNSVDSGSKTFKANFNNAVNVNLINTNFVSDVNPIGEVTKNNVTSVGFNLSGGEAILLEVLK